MDGNNFNSALMEIFKRQRIQLQDFMSTVGDRSDQLFQEEASRAENSIKKLGKKLEQVERKRADLRREMESLTEKCVAKRGTLDAESSKIKACQNQLRNDVDLHNLKAEELELCQKETRVAEAKALRMETALRTLQIEMLHIQRKDSVLKSATAADLERLEHRKVQAAELEQRMKAEYEAFRMKGQQCNETKSEYAALTDRVKASQQLVKHSWNMSTAAKNNLKRMNNLLEKQQSELKRYDQQWIELQEEKFKMEEFTMFLEHCRKRAQLAEEHKRFRQSN